jgi:hypothetical protein
MELSIACIIVLVAGSVAALGVGWAAHARMERAEATMVGPAVPRDDVQLLWYAVASLVWLSAAIVGVVGLCKREWARLGRNATWMLLVHVAVAVVAAVACAIVNERNPPPSTLLELVPLVFAACAIAAANILVACGFAWVWAGRRRDRVEHGKTNDRERRHAYRTPAHPVDGCAPEPRPGLWRFALYAGSLVFWPAGVAALLLLSKPTNAGVGAWAFRLSLVQIGMIAVLVCASVPAALMLA